MKTFITALLTVILTGQVYSTPIKSKTALTPTFDQTYSAAIEAGNKALNTFADTSCTAKNFTDVEDNFVLKLNDIIKLSDAIPANEDVLLQAKQTELYIGFLDLSKTIIEQQNRCVDDRDNKKTTDPNDSNS